jgi:hypothetical protein
MNSGLSTQEPAFLVSSCPCMSHFLLPESRDRRTRRCFLITRRPPEPGVVSHVEPEDCHHRSAHPCEWGYPYPDESCAPTVPLDGYELNAFLLRLQTANRWKFPLRVVVRAALAILMENVESVAHMIEQVRPQLPSTHDRLALAGTTQLGRSCLLDLLPQILRRSLVTGLELARASLTPRLAEASASQSLPSQLNRPGLGPFDEQWRSCLLGALR